jgi:hypothetical protein
MRRVSRAVPTTFLNHYVERGDIRGRRKKIGIIS